MILFLDACVIIYWIEGSEPFYSKFMNRLRTLRQRAPDATFAVSRLSWLECLVKPIREGDQDLLDEYQAFFDAGELQIVELTSAVVEQATLLRATYGLKTPDALQAACALRLGSDALFLTNDKRFRQAPMLDVEVLA